ncbi:MAG TPA: PHB depolymerase family esterase [Casimicrobiaceae bacterium]|nr:PHB depolymerase family esterase [Casimicrobiaceae bacterium]
MSNASLWSRVRDFAARLFRRKLPHPGRFVAGSKFSWRGWIGFAPWAWPSRDYLVYVPAGHTRWKRRPLIVLIHGCRQPPEELVAGTRISALADHHGWLVLLPRQTARANPWRCWNWFDKRTSGGLGEAAIIAAQIRAVRREYRAHPRRIFAAGMSAGGAMAALLGVQHRKLFAGIFVHSGVACGAASRPLTALDVLLHGADGPYEHVAAVARDNAPSGALPLPLVAIHGERDEVVAPINAVQLARQYLVLNRRLAPETLGREELPAPDAHTTEMLEGERTMTVIDYREGERTLVRLIRVSELGHAWSGGEASLPYNDPHPPDATGLLGEFVIEQIRLQRASRTRRFAWLSRA